MKLTILGTGNATVSECYNTCYAISDEGPVHNQLKKICYTADRSTTKKAVQKPEMEKSI